MRHRFFFPAFALCAGLVVLSVVSAVPGCSNQGEGERCDTNDDNGGNDDCVSGMQCLTPAALGNDVAKAYNADVCCPLDRTQATTAICSIQASAPGADSAPPPDTDASNDAGDGGDVSSEAGEDADANVSPESGADTSAPDSSGDAPVDAPEDTSLDAPAEGG